nr:hypothetical protein [Bacilli bacterium]
DLIQRNSSKFDVEVVQMKKRQDDSCGYINSEFSMTGTITLSVIINIYGNGTDGTGVPRLTCGNKDNQAVVEATSVKESDGARVYTYAVDGYFTLSTNSGNALYFSTMSFE